MANYNGANHTGFQNINLRGTGGNPPDIRGEIGSTGFVGTVQIGSSTYTDQNIAWTFPSKSGTFGITGTFSVDLPVVASSGYLSTAVTVAGIRTEDGVVVVPQTGAGVALQSARGALAVVDVLPGNGSLTLVLANIFATATVAGTRTYAYTAVR